MPQGCGSGLWGSQSDARYSCGQHLVFLDCFAAFSECRFSIPASESHRSVAKLISSLSHIPFGRSFGFQFVPQLVGSEKGLKLTPLQNCLNGVYNGKKSQYTAHQISGRKSLAISLMKLCTGSTIQKPSMSAFSATQADTASGAAQPQSLSTAALCFISDIQLWLSNESV